MYGEKEGGGRDVGGKGWGGGKWGKGKEMGGREKGGKEMWGGNGGVPWRKSIVGICEMDGELVMLEVVEVEEWGGCVDVFEGVVGGWEVMKAWWREGSGCLKESNNNEMDWYRCFVEVEGPKFDDSRIAIMLRTLAAAGVMLRMPRQLGGTLMFEKTYLHY